MKTKETAKLLERLESLVKVIVEMRAGARVEHLEGGVCSLKCRQEVLEQQK